MTERHRYTDEYFAARERSPTFQLEVDAFARELDRHGTRRGSILEAGTGAGALARELAVTAAQWIATDIDVDPMRHLQARRVLLVGCDATRLPMGAAAVDGVVAQHVIEHFADPVVVLTEWRRVLRPGGICVVTTPNREFPHSEWFDDPTHHELFDATRLRATFEAAGFANVRVLRLVPWLGTTRTVFLSARLQRRFPQLSLNSRRSLNLLAVGHVPRAT